MCRFYAHRASRPLSVAHELVDSGTSLLAQSCRDRRGESHGDGWGIGFYREGLPRVVRRAAAAAGSDEFLEQARQLRATTLVAHVRQASVGQRSEANSHPFTCGRWIFAHNGTVTGFASVAPRLQEQTERSLLAAIQGATDSELVFYWLVTKLTRDGIAGDDAKDRAAQVRDVVAGSVRQLADWCAAEPSEEPAKFNFLLTDGRLLVATRFRHALHLLDRNETDDASQLGRSVAVASEPVTAEPWREVPDQSIVTIDHDLTVDIRGI